KPRNENNQADFQIIDIVAMMRPLTKCATQIPNGNAIPRLIRDAFRIAKIEKPGPVHLELPEDVAKEEVSRRPFAVTKVEPPTASRGALERAAKMMNDAKRPLLLLASG